MWADLNELNAFYDGPAGGVARRTIRRRLRAAWPSVAGDTVLGLGYAGPYLRLFVREAERTTGILPEGSGARGWPNQGLNLLAQGQETRLPLPDLSFDRVLLVHALEGSESVRRFLREVWRVLADEGQLIVVAPHRRGIWARFDHTPFGHGRPYSAGQLIRLLTEQTFEVTHTEHALFVPPFRSKFLLSGARAWESVGRRVLRPFGGVVIAEARKSRLGGDAVPARPQRVRQTVPENGQVARDGRAAGNGHRKTEDRT